MESWGQKVKPQGTWRALPEINLSTSHSDVWPLSDEQQLAAEELSVAATCPQLSTLDLAEESQVSLAILQELQSKANEV